MIVYLLSTSPKNGVELMDGVEAITRGWWRPTPGSIYPLLKEMTEQGIVKKLEDGRYELSEKGRTQMQGSLGPSRPRPQTVDEMVDQLQAFLSHMEDAKKTGKADFGPRGAYLKDLARRLADLAE